MMVRVVFAVALATLLGAVPARAQTRFWTVCGGSTFNTCAAVELLVSGADVTVRVWNLSGVAATNVNTFAGTVFTGVGFENVGNVSAVAGSMTMTGPTRPGDTPASWIIKNDNEIGGGVKLDIVGTTENGVHNAIASGCATNDQLPGVNLWQNPCSLYGNAQNPGWVTLRFRVTGTWNLSGTYLLVKGQNGPQGQSTECITGGIHTNCGGFTPVPEPVTLTLLGSGLLGVGGIGALRRRRKADPPAA